jgi:AbiV family abortive infection protein
MRDKALGQLSSTPVRKRLPLIAEGLTNIQVHVQQLRHGIDESFNPSQSEILAQLAEEEAAKALILLDIVRTGWRDTKAINALFKAFYNHFSRCLYAELVEIKPTKFGELRDYVEVVRVNRHLDGPNDIDWEFSNDILRKRVDSLYVDLVEYEDDGPTWTDPSKGGSPFGTLTPASNLIDELGDAGCFTTAGLVVIADTWKGAQVDDETPWSEARERNREIFTALEVPAENISRKMLEQWHFPIGQLNLGLRIVSDDELEAERKRNHPGL